MTRARIPCQAATLRAPEILVAESLHFESVRACRKPGRFWILGLCRTKTRGPDLAWRRLRSARRARAILRPLQRWKTSFLERPHRARPRVEHDGFGNLRD